MKKVIIKVYNKDGNYLIDECDVHSIADALQYCDWVGIDISASYLADSFKNWYCCILLT
jgi:hypothetical protein